MKSVQSQSVVWARAPHSAPPDLTRLYLDGPQGLAVPRLPRALSQTPFSHPDKSKSRTLARGPHHSLHEWSPQGLPTASRSGAGSKPIISHPQVPLTGRPAPCALGSHCRKPGARATLAPGTRPLRSLQRSRHGEGLGTWRPGAELQSSASQLHTLLAWSQGAFGKMKMVTNFFWRLWPVLNELETLVMTHLTPVCIPHGGPASLSVTLPWNHFCTWGVLWSVGAVPLL